MDDKIEIKPASEIQDDPVRGRPAKYPFGQMQIGDAFYLPPGHFGALGAKSTRQPRAFISAYSYTRRHPEFRFRCRSQRDGGVRIERIPVKE